MAKKKASPFEKLNDVAKAVDERSSERSEAKSKKKNEKCPDCKMKKSECTCEPEEKESEEE